MTQENKELFLKNKELLLKDLSARLLYGVKVQINSDVKKVAGVKNGFVVTKERGLYSNSIEYITRIECCRPYLRSISSMTEEEMEELLNIDKKRGIYSSRHLTWHIDGEITDWLNKKMFDWRGLIPMNLALEAPEGMYKI